MASYPTTALQPGSTNTTAVKQLQDYLVSQGFMTRTQVNTGYGTYGPQTTAAVLAYQKAKGIDYSSGPGYWGPKTIAATSGSSTTTTTKPTTTTTTAPKPTYTAVPSSPQPAPPTGLQSMTGYQPLDKSILSSITSNLGPGMANDPNQVKVLQQALVNAGYMTAAQMATGPGTYGPQTTAAVAKWQQMNGIPTAGNDGYFGPVSKNFIQTGAASSPTAPIIDPSATKPNNTAITDPYQIPPGIIPPEAGNSGIMSLPKEAVGVMVPQLKPGTPEYQAAMNKINTAYYDVLQQQMNAKTEQDQQAAQYNWKVLKNNIETNLNIKLSDDAFQAWDQVQGLKNSFGQQNIEGSGLQAEATDAYLRKIRQADANSRTGAKTEEEARNMDYYTKFATPQQIKAFAAANPELAKQWGLIPSDSIRSAMSLSALKAKYPNVPDADLQAYIATVLDENGNYRSNLYQNYMTGSSPGASPGNEQKKYDPVTGAVIGYTVTPSDLGVADINAARTQFQVGTLQNQNDAATAAYNTKLAANSTNIKSSSPASDTVSGTASGTRFNSITPAPTTTTTAPRTSTPTLSNPIAAPTTTIKPTTTTTIKPTTTTTTAPKPTTTTTTAPKTTYGTLYDYYKATTGSMPAWNSPTRLAQAKAAGITNYTGTSSQNAQLLSYLTR